MARRHIKTEIKVYIPFHLDVEKLQEVVGSHTNRVMLFYRILFETYRYRYNSECKLVFNYLPDYSVTKPFKCRALDKIIGDKQSGIVLKKLKDAKLLIVKNQMHDRNNPAKSKPREYGIPEELLGHSLFNGCTPFRVLTVDDKKLCNAYVNYKNYRRKKLVEGHLLLNQLSKGLENLYLDLTSDASQQIIKENGYDVMPIGGGETYLERLERLNSRDVEWFIKDRFGGRFHYAWVNLRKKCLPMVRFKGFDSERIKEIDLANSQPYFSSIINRQTISAMLPKAIDLIDGIDFNTPDWDAYRTSCLDGTFYERWIDALKEYCGNDWLHQLINEEQEKVDRKTRNSKKTKKKIIKNKYIGLTERNAAKKSFYSVLFGTQKKEDISNKVFALTYKDVATGFITIKSRLCVYNTSKKNANGNGTFTNVAWIMQSLESKIMLETALKSLLNQGITQVFTKHDSICGIESMMPQVENEIKAAFRQYGLPIPRIIIK